MPNISKNVSNQYGRALEYAIVAEIVQRLPQSQVQLTPRADEAQQRDLRNYTNLKESMQQNYKRCANCVFNWLNASFSISNSSIQIDRLPDSASKQGDVTDIRISTASSTINLSVKHNHKALKHQRPSATAQHCRFSRRSQEDENFRANYRAITKNFSHYAIGFSKFSDLDQQIILNNLYIPVCNLVAEFINQHCTQQVNASHLFTFLVGKFDFYKLIFNEKNSSLTIEEFTKLSLPTSVTAQKNQNYVYLNFSNSWKISMRLHTASSEIKNNPDLKFDTQPVEIIVPKEIINV